MKIKNKLLIITIIQLFFISNIYLTEGFSITTEKETNKSVGIRAITEKENNKDLKIKELKAVNHKIVKFWILFVVSVIVMIIGMASGVVGLIFFANIMWVVLLPGIVLFLLGLSEVTYACYNIAKLKKEQKLLNFPN